LTFPLDTNVVSELANPNPDPGVLRWLYEVDEDRVFLSVITLAELQFGIQRWPPGAPRTRLESWVQKELPDRFSGRVLKIDEPVAAAWGEVMARSEALGRRMSTMGGFLAATAAVASLTLVTRNREDFVAFQGQLLTPRSA
jgi:toxin FitB